MPEQPGSKAGVGSMETANPPWRLRAYAERSHGEKLAAESAAAERAADEKAVAQRLSKSERLPSYAGKSGITYMNDMTVLRGEAAEAYTMALDRQQRAAGWGGDKASPTLGRFEAYKRLESRLEGTAAALVTARNANMPAPTYAVEQQQREHTVLIDHAVPRRSATRSEQLDSFDDVAPLCWGVLGVSVGLSAPNSTWK
jgi:hypothetical protein